MIQSSDSKRNHEHGLIIIESINMAKKKDRDVVLCGSCVMPMTLVRPGKHQCDNPRCSNNMEALENEIAAHTDVYEIFTQEDGHEYTLEVTDISKQTIYTLRAAHSPEWSEDVKGKVLMRLVDDGYGFVTDRKGGMPSVAFNEIDGKIEYDRAEYMRIILTFDNAVSTQPAPKYRVVKQGNTLTI